MPIKIVLRLLAVFALKTSLCALPGIANAESLEQALTSHRVPIAGLSAAERSQAITSYAWSKSSNPTLFAYYGDDGSGLLRSPLHVLRYDGKNRLSRMELTGKPHVDWSPVMHQVDDFCLGSVLDIEEVGTSTYLNTHINPSAGCVIILSSRLRFKAALWGWVMATSTRFAIVHGNSIHFADTHPATVAVYDFSANTLTAVYPPKHDPLRSSFSTSLQAYAPADTSCREENKACDPAQFMSDISECGFSASADDFSFLATINPEGFGEKAEREIQPVTVRYSFRYRGGKWLYTESK